MKVNIFKYTFVVFLGILPFGTKSQSNESLVEMHRLAKLNSRSSNYISTPLNAPLHNESNTLFEAGIYANLKLINNSQDPNSLKYKYADFDFNMFLTLRMYNEFSSPIYPLNYQPGFNYIKFFKPNKNTYSYLDFEIKHLSNGQSGTFYRPETDSFNLATGDFSTNYLSVKYTRIHKIKDFRLFQTYGFRIDGGIPNSILSLESELKQSYGIYRLMADFQGISPSFSILKSDKQFLLIGRIENTYILGDLSEYHSEQKYRYSLKAKLSLYPAEGIRFGGFIQYYTGRDYYNVRFINNISVLSLGLTFNL
ncbi:hypothetical protein KFE94_16965 [bacterium SCSIO 12643]|nr:hypothetical protein KFE94_16965 [bacterium SCSIO 12643]